MNCSQATAKIITGFFIAFVLHLALFFANPRAVRADLGCTGCHGTADPQDVRPLDAAERDVGTGGFAGSHRKHLAAGVNPVACDLCHSGPAGAPSTYTPAHRDGKIQLSDDMNPYPQPETSSYLKNGTRALLFDQASVPHLGSCTNLYCHSNGKGGVASPEWGNAPTGACGTCHATDTIASNAHQPHLTAAYGPRLSGQGVPNSCRSCHSYTTGPSGDHVNGTLQVSGCTTACHRNAIPAWSGGRVSCESCHTGNLSVINGITASAKADFTTRGHGQAAANFAASRQCNSCHDQDSAHIDGAPGSAKRLAVNGNTLCESCHNDPAKVPTAGSRDRRSHVIDINGQPLMGCAVCHDSHGTSNPAMLRTRIRFGNLSATVTLANISSGLVQTTPPYKGFCQVCHTKTKYFTSGVAQAISAHASYFSYKCSRCHNHGDSYAFRERSHEMENLYLADVNGNLISPLTDDYNFAGMYHYLEAFSLDRSCVSCHVSHFDTNYNRHAGLGTEAMTGRGIDPARPWVQGPGTFGSWSPVHNRQLADLKTTYGSETEFTGKVDMAAYEFVNLCGVCHTGGGPGDENNFTFSNWTKYDLMRGTTSPGPVHKALRYRYRNDSLAADYIVNNGNHLFVPINSWDFYVDNKATVIPDSQPDGAGVMKIAGWGEMPKNGTLKSDCFMCHLEGYDHLKRNEQIARYGYLDNAIGAGGGFATIDTSGVYGGLLTNYFTDMVKTTTPPPFDGSTHLYFDRSFTDRINAFPPAANCAVCHIPTKLEGEDAATQGDAWKKGFLAAEAVPGSDPANPDPVIAANRVPARMRADYLKRGDVWRVADDEAHAFDCSRCHSQTGKFQARRSDQPDFKHGPGKGHDPLRWPGDPLNDTVKYCEDCHQRKGDLNGDGTREMVEFGASDGRFAHERAGLLASIVPGAMRIKDGSSAEETFLGNHLDVISCTACHVNKQYAVARSVDFSTGGEFYNFAGNPGSLVPTPDAAPLAFSWRENTTRKLVNGSPNPFWRRQIFPFNYLAGIYWNNVGTKDANGDGFTTGANNNGATVIGDPFFARTIKTFFSYSTVNARKELVAGGMKGASGFASRNDWAMTNGDGAVTFTRPAEIAAFRQNMTSSEPGFVPQLRLEAEPYLVMHNVMPGSKGLALGRPKQVDSNGKVTTYGCDDCHGSSGGIYNGGYDMLGKGTPVAGGPLEPLVISWSNTGDVTTQAVYWKRDGTRGSLDFSSNTSTREPQRWEFLGYDAGRVTALDGINPFNYGFGADPVTTVNTVLSGPLVTAGFTTMTMPHTRIFIDWGDGTNQWIDGIGDITGIVHTYPRSAPFYNGESGMFEFQLYLQVYDGSTRKEGKLLMIRLP